MESSVIHITEPVSAGDLPTGLSDFAELRARRQVYVDKTAYIARLLQEHQKFVFLARPRRFGKTLLLSTLKYLFARDSRAFQGTLLRASTSWSQIPQCTVVVLDMSGVSVINPDAIEAEMRYMVDDQCRALGIDLPEVGRSPGSALRYLIQSAQATYGRQVVVLVDEYDAPVTKMLGRLHPVSAEAAEHVMMCLRDFYSTLKICDAQLEFVFLTGISHVEGAGLFSSLNNLMDISAHPAYHGICGFTETEIRKYLGAHVAMGAVHYGCTVAEMEELLRYHYNGYRFAIQSEPVYNPHSILHVLYVLGHREKAQAIRIEGFPQPWLQAGIPYFLFQHLKKRWYDIQNLAHDPRGVREAFDLHNPNVEALMFQSGFLTLKPSAGNRWVLAYPNREVETGFKEGLLLTYLGRTHGDRGKVLGVVHRMYTALLQGAYSDAFGWFDRLLDTVPWELLETESHFQSILHTICLFMPEVKVFSEYHVRRGRADTVLETPDTVMVIEFKRDQSARVAYDQLLQKEYWKGFPLKTPAKKVVGIGLNFNTPKGQGCQWTPTQDNWEIVHKELYSPVADGSGV